jgi:hypothetical protein
MFRCFYQLISNFKFTAMPTIKSLRTIKFILPLLAVITAISVFAFAPGDVSNAKKVNDHYRFTLNNPLMATTSSYVTNVNNWSSDLVPVQEDDFQCQSGDYQPCEILTAIGDVNTSTHKLKGSISASIGSSSFYVVNGYTPTTGSASFNNRQQ